MPLIRHILRACSLDQSFIDRRHIGTPFEKTSQGVAFRTFGQGEPLVLLHGGAGNWHHWVRNVDALAERFQVMAIDQPCYGDSDAVPWDTADEAYLTLCAAAIEEMTAGHDRIHLAGFSFGGYIAAEIAVRLSPRVASLSMTGGAGYGKPEGRGFTLDSAKRMRARLGRNPTDAELLTMHAENLGKLMLWEKSLIDDWTTAMQKRNVERTRFDSRRLSWADRTPGCVGEASCPVMIVYGEHDAACIPPIEERLKRCRAVKPGLISHIIPECGHWAMYEAADTVNALMLDFHGAA